MNRSIRTSAALGTGESEDPSHEKGRERAGPTPLYLHIGAPKTGTTYLQRILWRNQEALRGARTLYPGDDFGAHVRAAFDLRNAGFQGYQDPRVAGTWRQFVREASDWDGRVVFSQELFSPATYEQVDAALSDLSFAEVHIIYTARELSKQIPAAWQEDLKNRFTLGFNEFIDALRDPSKDAQGLGRMFWRMQDPVEVLRRWSRNLPPSNIHVVTVPRRPDPPDLLWRRFCGVIGIDPEKYDTSNTFANSSLGGAESALLRRVNLALNNEVGWPLYSEMIKHYLAQEVMVARPKPISIRLGPADMDWARERADEIIEQLSSAGYNIVGSLDELQVPRSDESQASNDPGREIVYSQDDVPIADQLDVAVEAIAALLLRISRLRRKVIQP